MKRQEDFLHKAGPVGGRAVLMDRRVYLECRSTGSQACERGKETGVSCALPAWEER